MYQKTVTQSLQEQSKEEATAADERGGARPATPRAVFEKDMAIQAFIRQYRAAGGANSGAVCVYWTEEFGEFLTDPPRPATVPEAAASACFVFWSAKDKSFMQVPLAKAAALKNEVPRGWWFVLDRNEPVTYVSWCDGCKCCHNTGWRLRDVADLVPVETVAPAVHRAPTQSGSASAAGVASVGAPSEKDLAILAFIRRDRAAAGAAGSDTTYVYWTEQFGEFRADPPAPAAVLGQPVSQYVVFWSDQDHRFMQTPLAGSERVTRDLPKGRGVALARSGLIRYAFWCSQCQDCHLQQWQLQDSPDTLPVAVVEPNTHGDSRSSD